MMTETDGLEELDFDVRVTCDVRHAGKPCPRLAALVIRGCCPSCAREKPRDFLVCVPCWSALSRSMMTCHMCAHIGAGTSFYRVIGPVS